MYVVTFYSFKGGVGRSMALVNVAAELTARGKRVLMVDFDLEAPGLDTFDITRSEETAPGLIDFVCDFRISGEVPDAKQYMYKADCNIGEGELWVMASGLQDSQYQKRFQSVDWADLYEKHQGFLLFEDLKLQWKSLNFDYVLVDSRTGHTDVAGICTRQLPDAVAVLFYPNEQNRRGLELIVSKIRNEASGPQKKKIELHFVMSNVPDLDDEEEILGKEMKRFEESLGFGSPTIIHHYDSLALLEQITFAKKRPRSRLAREYAGLTKAIVRKNLEDRVGALALLDLGFKRGNVGARSIVSEKQLQLIRSTHADDPKVLAKLAFVRSRQMKNEEALAILSEAIAARTPEDPELLLRRARLHVSLAQRERAVSDLKAALASPEASGFDLAVALRMLREVKPDLVQLISRSPALDSLDPDSDLIEELETSPETLSLAVRLLTKWLPDLKDNDLYTSFRGHQLLCLIGLGSYREAIGVFGAAKMRPEELEIPDAYNYAMALWGMQGAVPPAFLEYLSQATNQNAQGPNILQCYALINRLVGKKELAFELLAKARESNLSRGASSFSCWSYLNVSAERFASDLEEMGVAFEKEQFTPEFITRNSLEAPSR